jgi:hypothetical protein
MPIIFLKSDIGAVIRKPFLNISGVGGKGTGKHRYNGEYGRTETHRRGWEWGAGKRPGLRRKYQNKRQI